MKDEYDFSEGRRGAVLRPSLAKTRITIRIDDDVLEWFRQAVHESGGGSYQSMINQALRDHVENAIEPLEETLRRVLREVLPEAKMTTPKKPRKSGPRTKSATGKRRA